MRIEPISVHLGVIAGARTMAEIGLAVARRGPIVPNRGKCGSLKYPP